LQQYVWLFVRLKRVQRLDGGQAPSRSPGIFLLQLHALFAFPFFLALGQIQRDLLA
jgi:hypothetical protein